MIARVATVTALVLLALPVAAALADDASLQRSWARYVKASGHQEIAIITERLAPLEGGLRRQAKLIDRAREAVAPDRASTPLGASGRKAALRSLGRATAAIRAVRRLLALVVGRDQPGRRALKRLARIGARAGAASEEADRLERRATRLFRRATS